MSDSLLDRCAVPEPAEVTALTAGDFELIRRLAREKFGLDLREGKQALVSARLGKKVRELGFRSFRQYYIHVLEDPSGEALVGMIDALTTSFTSFFREPAHFDYLRETVLPLLRSRAPLRVWCAAAATGEEPYSLAMCLLESLPDMADRIEILATDISTKALAAGQSGVYAGEKVESVPSHLARKYLLRGHGRSAGWVRFRPEVRRLIRFRRLNLMEDFASAGQFPVIFCRNVMIYFDRATQTELVARLSDRLEPGGYLFLGHSEGLAGLSHSLEYRHPAVYQKGDGTLRRKR